MSTLTQEKKTIGIILGIIFPGVGHIYIGEKKERNKGIKIVIAFIIISYFFGRSFGFFNFFDFMYPIPIVGIWLWQLRDLLKIVERNEYML